MDFPLHGNLEDMTSFGKTVSKSTVIHKGVGNGYNN